MHELSLCRSIYGIVDGARQERRVSAVHLQVGQLRQVVPQTLEYCWSMLTETTPLEGAVLDVDHVPVRLDCRACGARTTVEHVLVLTCAGCGSGDIILHTGEEFLVTSIDLEPAPCRRKDTEVGRFHRHDDGVAHSHEHDDQHTDHGDHSSYATGTERVSVLERIFTENDRAADANRAAFDAHGVRAVNLMSSPGAGKTTLLVHTLRHLQEAGVRAGVVEGDIETSIDADRLSGLGAQVSLLNTGNGFGGECHLDAPMVASALGRLDLDALDLLVVENVGNLVCPAEFDVGAHDSVMVYAITEGEEKPLKYPVMFRSVAVVLVNKMDLLPHLDFDLGLFRSNLARVNPDATVIEVSARTGEGLGAWHAWLTGALVP